MQLSFSLFSLLPPYFCSRCLIFMQSWALSPKKLPKIFGKKFVSFSMIGWFFIPYNLSSRCIWLQLDLCVCKKCLQANTFWLNDSEFQSIHLVQRIIHLDNNVLISNSFQSNLNRIKWVLMKWWWNRKILLNRYHKAIDKQLIDSSLNTVYPVKCMNCTEWYRFTRNSTLPFHCCCVTQLQRTPSCDAMLNSENQSTN